ncbi:MAG: hypothetical protein ACRDWT_09615, partial [Jatrophihabitantaceae bacterium]
MYTAAAASEFWNLPMLGYIDTSASPGTTYTYKIKATDPDGNSATSNSLTVTTPTSASPPDGPYVTDVLNAG